MAALSYGDVQPTTKNITLTASFTPAVVTGVDNSVSSSRINYTFVTTRLLSFTLSATPLFFSTNAPLEPTHQPTRKKVSAGAGYFKYPQ